MAEGGRRGGSAMADVIPRKQLRSSTSRSAASSSSAGGGGANGGGGGGASAVGTSAYFAPPESPRTRSSVAPNKAASVGKPIFSGASGSVGGRASAAAAAAAAHRSSQPFKKRSHPPTNVTAGQGRFQKNWRNVFESQPEEEDEDDEDDEEEEEEEEDDDEEDQDGSGKGKGKEPRKPPRRRGKNIETLLEAVAKEKQDLRLCGAESSSAGRQRLQDISDSSVIILDDSDQVEVIDVDNEEMEGDDDDDDATEVSREEMRQVRQDLAQTRRRERELAEENRRLREANQKLEQRESEAAADLDGLADDLQCPVCLTLPREPHTCPRGHSLCRECRDQLRLCPTCRAPLAKDSGNYLLKKIVHQILTHSCRHDVTGCPSRVKLDELEPHEARCPHRGVTCPGCGVSLTMKRLRSHLDGPPTCYLNGYIYASPKGITMSEALAQRADGELAGMVPGTLFKWKPLTITFEEKLCFVSCYLHAGPSGKSLTIHALTDGCEEESANMRCCVTVGRSKKEYMEPHGRKISETLRPSPVDRSGGGAGAGRGGDHVIEIGIGGGDGIFVNEKSYGALIGSASGTVGGAGRSRASFYLHAEVFRTVAQRNQVA